MKNALNWARLSWVRSELLHAILEFYILYRAEINIELDSRYMYNVFIKLVSMCDVITVDYNR